jgi:hypothetical protein
MANSDLPSRSRALVVLARAANETRAFRPMQRAATFLTQLLATSLQVPQARERRRAEPVEVIAAYRAAVARLQEPNRN